LQAGKSDLRREAGMMGEPKSSLFPLGGDPSQMLSTLIPPAVMSAALALRLIKPEDPESLATFRSLRAESQARSRDIFEIARERGQAITTRLAALMVLTLIGSWTRGGAKQVVTLHGALLWEAPGAMDANKGFESQVLRNALMVLEALAAMDPVNGWAEGPERDRLARSVRSLEALAKAAEVGGDEEASLACARSARDLNQLLDMRPEQEDARFPSLSEIVDILSAPPAAGLFPIGDCGEQEFRELLCTTTGGPFSWAERPKLVSSPPEAVLEHLPDLVSRMRAERQALREQLPERYGILQGDLSVAYQELAKQRPLPFLARAIALYHDLLDVFTLEDFPERWAATQFNLGLAYQRLPEDRQKNLEQAIACFQKALLVRTREDFGEEWAATQNNLGAAYRDLPDGDRQKNLEQAIACFQQALLVRTREDSPDRWAALQNNLAATYNELPGADRQLNLERAIACYQRALEVYTREAFPEQWAMTLNNLGKAYGDLPGGDPQINLERAIACYENALLVCTREAFPADWANIQNNLGSAYSDLPGQDRQGNLERAIACFQSALTVYTREDSPERWAGAQNNLGSAYSDLPRGVRQVNLEKAIGCYENALLVYTREAFPADWAGTQNNLGNAYSELPGVDRQRNLEKAVACLQGALEVYTPEAFPIQWAMTQNNLGGAYRELQGEAYRRNLEKAIACYQAALTVFTREAFPADWARTQVNLGNAYNDVPGGEPRAIEAWHEVIIYLHEIVPISVEHLHLAAEIANLVRRVVPGLIDLGRTAGAVGVLEQGRAIGLRLELTRRGRTPTGLTATEHEEYRTLSATARDIASTRRRIDDLPLAPRFRSDSLVRLGQRYKQTLARLRELEERDSAFAVAPPSYALLKQLAADRDLALVYLQPTDQPSHGAVGAVIHRGSPPDAPAPPDVVRLNGLSVIDIKGILFLNPTGASFAKEHFQTYLAAGQQGQQLGWIFSYLLEELADDRDQRDAARASWQGTIRSVLDRLGGVLAPLIDRLRQVDAHRVVLLPGGRLSLLPLHAVPVSGARGGAEVFGEEFTISYAPSAVALSLSMDRAQRNRSRQPRLAAIGNPDGSLPFADEEVIAVAARFGDNSQVARGPGATRTWLDSHAAEAHFLELATHALFDLATPSASRIILAPGGPEAGLSPDDVWRGLAAGLSPDDVWRGLATSISLDDLWGGRFRIREGCVVTASACETGLTDYRNETDESLGFPSAFLGLGASSVIASLWAVNDLSTALLMEKVYELLLEHGCSSAVALQQASHWLRKLPREDVRRWLEPRIATLTKELAQFDVPQPGYTPEQLAAAKDLEDRQELLTDALDRLDSKPDPPFAHPVFWAAFVAYGA
jgi:CHAT domain-containing protein/tetratricopeptide (TPR) repeat protein